MRRQRLYDPIVIALLRSPLHSLMGSSLMLITVRGHRSGRRYTTPVGFVPDGGDLLVLSWCVRTWWRNLRGGAAVRVRLRGRKCAATATVDEDIDQVAESVLRLRRRSPGLQPRLQLPLDSDGRPTDTAALRAFADRAVVARVTPAVSAQR